MAFDVIHPIHIYYLEQINLSIIMEASNQITLDKKVETPSAFKPEDNFAMKNMKYAQGIGAAIRYANELHAVKQTNRLPFLQSSRLHEDVLRGNLGAGTGFRDMFGESEEHCSSRLAFL